MAVVDSAMEALSSRLKRAIPESVVLVISGGGLSPLVSVVCLALADSFPAPALLPWLLPALLSASSALYSSFFNLDSMERLSKCASIPTIVVQSIKGCCLPRRVNNLRFMNTVYVTRRILK